MAISNLYWTLIETDGEYTLERLVDGQGLTGLALAEVRALAAIAELAGSGPPPGLTSTMGIETEVEVRKYGKAKS